MKKGVAVFIVSLTILSLILTIVSCTSAPAAPQTAEEFFRNNEVTLIVNGSAGATTDLGGRSLASYWAEVTGGKAMPVKLMSGGGGIEGLNAVYNAKPDGLTIGVTTHSSDITLPVLMALPGPAFDTKTLGWIGMFGTSAQGVALRADAPWKTLEDLQKAPKIIFGTSNPGSGPAIDTVAAIELLGLKNAQVLFGYEMNELKLACKRGEIDGYGASSSTLKNDESLGSIRSFVTLSNIKTPWYPNTPAITDMMKPVGVQEDILSLLIGMNGGKVFFTPPNVPADKLNYLRRTFDKIMAHEGFLKVIKPTFPIWEKPATGEEVEALTNKLLSMPKARTDALQAVFKKYVK